MLVISNEQAIKDQIDREFPFTVDKFPLSGPDGMKTDLYGCFRSDTCENVGGAVKKNYLCHTLDDMKALAIAGMTGFDGAQLRCSWNRGHCLIIEPTKEYRRAVYGTQDAIFPRAIIKAGFGGLKGVDGFAGLHRDACLNLMRLRVAGKVVRMKIKHTTGLMDKINSLVQEFQRLLQSWNGIVDQAVEMNSRELDFRSFIREVYPMPEAPTPRQIVTYDDRILAVIRRVEKERKGFGRLNSSLAKATAWEAYNAIQGYEQHDARRHGRMDYYQRAFLAMETPAVDRAYDLALQMAT